MSKILLKNCCSFQEGYVNPSQLKREYFHGPIKWLRASDLNDGFVYDTEKSLSIKGFQSAGKSSILFKRNTIAISKSGTIGKLGILKNEMCGNRAVINIDINQKIANTFYVFYTLKYKKNEIISKAGGSIQKNLYVSSLESISLNHSKIAVQQKIGKVLSDLDAKIELNKKINSELEAMAKTLYDYWFVQFDFPDVEGKPYKTSGSKMVWNEELKREIPKGWEVKPIKEISEFKNGTGIKNTDFDENGNYNVFGSNGIVGKTNHILFTEAVIAVGRVGANYGEVHYSLKSCWISDNAITVQPTNKIYLWWLIETLKRINYSNISGGSAQPLITQGKLKELKFAMPTEDLFKVFFEKVNAQYLQINLNNEQNQQLASLRDWLLPMLMNGQVRVGDVEEELGMVAEPEVEYGKE